MKRRQAREGEPQLLASRRTGRVGRARQPGSDFPERAARTPEAIDPRDRGSGTGMNPSSAVMKEPAMNLLEVFSARPVRGPGAQDERTMVRARNRQSRAPLRPPPPPSDSSGDSG